jgi:hypothetical protein
MECCRPPTLPVRQEKGKTAIIYDEPSSGCLLPPPCCQCVKARSHARVNEDSLEYNRPCFNVCCCSTVDSVKKLYFDLPPFGTAFGGMVVPQISTYRETCYCIGVIPLHFAYESCIKPCYGEMLCISPCFCPCLGCPVMQQRCCSIPFLGGLTNAENFKEIVNAQARKVQSYKA